MAMPSTDLQTLLSEVRCMRLPLTIMVCDEYRQGTHMPQPSLRFASRTKSTELEIRSKVGNESEALMALVKCSSRLPSSSILFA